MTQHYGNDRGGPAQGPREEPGELRAQAQQVGEQAKAQARSALDQQARTAAGKLDHLADSVTAAAQRLEESGDSGLSHYVSGMAGSLGDLADGMRNKNVDELMRDVRTMAQRNPALFITGSLAIGFGLARFARASAQRSHATDGDARLSGDYGSSSERGNRDGSGIYTGSGYGNSGLGASSGSGGSGLGASSGSGSSGLGASSGSGLGSGDLGRNGPGGSNAGLSGANPSRSNPPGTSGGKPS